LAKQKIDTLGGEKKDEEMPRIFDGDTGDFLCGWAFVQKKPPP
jgi:hypothetical protein